MALCLGQKVCIAQQLFNAPNFVLIVEIFSLSLRKWCRGWQKWLMNRNVALWWGGDFF